MKHLKIAYTTESKEYFSTNRDLVLAEDTDLYRCSCGCIN